MKVGEINNLKITGNKVIAIIELNSDFQATKGTVAQTDTDNIFGKKSLVLTPTENTEFLADGDTIYAISGNWKLAVYLRKDSKKSNLYSIMKGINLDSLDIDGLLKKVRKIMETKDFMK